MAWLPRVSTTVEPARFDIARCASGGIILSSVATRYQLGFAFHDASVTSPARASTPQGTCEFARNAARSGGTSAAKDAANLLLSNIRKPLTGGRIGGTGAPGAGFAMIDLTDS